MKLVSLGLFLILIVQMLSLKLYFSLMVLNEFSRRFPVFKSLDFICKYQTTKNQKSFEIWNYSICAEIKPLRPEILFRDIRNRSRL